MNFKIAVFYSFETEIIQEFEKDTYIKIFCGDINSVSKDFISKMDYVDSENDNISHMNKYINEMTGIYWLYKNYEKIGNPDFIGTAHYRRYLDNTNSKLNDNTIICHFERQPYTIFQTYSLYHVKDDIVLFNYLFSKKYPEHEKYLTDYMNQNIQSVRNMFIMSKDMFFDYGRFMDECICVLNEMKPYMCLDERDKYQIRGMGFILERMTGFWIYYKNKSFGTNIVNTEIISKDIYSPYQR